MSHHNYNKRYQDACNANDIHVEITKEWPAKGVVDRIGQSYAEESVIVQSSQIAQQRYKSNSTANTTETAWLRTIPENLIIAN